MTKEELILFQREQLEKQQEELAKRQKEYQEYLESEAYERDLWNEQEARWEQTFAKRGIRYEKKPFVSAFERKQQAERAKQEEIVRLEEKLKALRGY